MASELCKIVYDNPTATYLPGQTLSGTVEITLDEPKKIRGIIIHYRGAAETHWTEGEYDSDSIANSRTVTYSGEEVYFDTHYYCTGSKKHEAFQLSAGVHVYSFSYDLPINLPSSFTGKAGHISYFVEVTIDRPWLRNQSTKFPFLVTSPYDLNMYSRLKHPASVTKEKTFCCWCCKNGPLTVIMTASQAGYVPGETISVVIDLDNASSVDIKKIELKFQLSTTFYAKYLSSSTKEETEVYEEMNLGRIGPRCSNMWQRRFIVPPVLPSCPNISSIIHPEYQIRLEAEFSGCHNDMKMSLPIIIGTAPFRSVANSPRHLENALAISDSCGGDVVKQVGWVQDLQHS